MEPKKFLRYCPNCNNYNESSGVCIYIHENVLQYPDKFIKYCDGKYLSLIPGKAIEPLKESDTKVIDMEQNEKILISVFTTNKNALFQVAKSLLDNFRIKFFSSGEYLNPLNSAAYGTEIKVFKKDEKVARKLLDELEPKQFHPANKFENNMLSVREYLYIGIIILSIIIMITIFSLLK